MNSFLRPQKIMFYVFTLLSLFMAACEPGESPETIGREQLQKEQVKAIRIGGKDFTEQHVLLKIASIFLKEKGYEVFEARNMNSKALRSALEDDHIDVCWEYTGTALVVYHNQEAETDADIAYKKVEEIDKEKGLVWLDKTEVDSPYVIMMRQDRARELDIASISGLAGLIRRGEHQLIFGSNVEFYEREDGLSGLQKRYGFSFPEQDVVKMDLELLYGALKDDQVDVSVGVGTDGRIKAFNLVILKDDRHFFPAYNAAPVVREEYLQKNPEIADLLNLVSERLDTPTMRHLNYLVDVEHEDVIEVVRKWLSDQNLI